jgi:uncharacterized protein
LTSNNTFSFLVQRTPNRRWTAGFKQNVWNSRINTTATLAKAIDKTSDKPKVFINISGVSHYLPDPNKTYTEADTVKSFDFMSELCVAWEKAASLSENSVCRLVKIRTGAVLGREGGMIQSLIVPFFFGVGGPIGDGKQGLPWIHITDLCNFIQYAIENDSVKGTYNGVAPEIITNNDFTKAFASAMCRPAFIPLPEFAVNLIFGKERSVLLAAGAKINPKNTLDSGYKYTHPDIKSACADVAKLF